MRAYQIDCTGAAPVVNGYQRILSVNPVDFGMVRSNAGPPNALRLADGRVAVAGNSLKSGTNLYFLVFNTDGTLYSETLLDEGNTYFIAAFISPTDPTEVTVVGDTGLYTISGVDTPTPTHTYQEMLVKPTNVYVAGASSPYFEGPGWIDTNGDNTDPQENLYAVSMRTFQKSLIGQDNWNTSWVDGGGDLGDGRTIAAMWGTTIAEAAMSSPYVDAYSRIFFIDDRAAPFTTQVVDVKPKDLLPDHSTDGYMAVDQLNIGSTSLAFDGRKGLVVRATTCLSDGYPIDPATRDGDRYSVMVWALRSNPSSPTDALPPAPSTPLYDQVQILDVIPTGTETFMFVSQVYNGPPNYDYTYTWSALADDAKHVRVGTAPVLASADADTSYLKFTWANGDPVYGSAGMMVGPWTPPTDKTFVALDVEFDYYIDQPLGGYQTTVRIGPPPGTVSTVTWPTVSPANNTTFSPATPTIGAWQTYTVTIPIDASALALLATGDLYVGVAPSYYAGATPVNTRLSRLSVKARVLGPSV